jgi:hypothetical protein
VLRRGAQNKEFFRVLKDTHMWSDTFSVTSADGKDATQALEIHDIRMPAPHVKKGQPWSVVYVPAGETKNDKVQVAYADRLQDFPAKIEEVVSKAMSTEAPHLTVRNHRQLCGAGHASRTFCLFIVDETSQDKVNKVIEALVSSRAEYSKELAEMKEAEEGGSEETTAEEPFRIQPVRVMTGTSRWPSQPVAVRADFHTAWAEVGYAPMFLLELETKRVAAVKDSILSQVMQQIAYEDIKFKELPEDFSPGRAFPDPEVPLTRALFKIISSPFGFILTWLLMAVALALGPELPLAHNAAAAGAFVALVVVVWPLATRKLLGVFAF